MNPLEINKEIATYMGLYYHPKIYLQGWSTFRGEKQSSHVLTDVWSIHKILVYKDSEAPRYWKMPCVVDEQETSIIRELLYDQSYELIMPVVDKIQSMDYRRILLTENYDTYGYNIQASIYPDIFKFYWNNPTKLIDDIADIRKHYLVLGERYDDPYKEVVPDKITAYHKAVGKVLMFLKNNEPET